MEASRLLQRVRKALETDFEVLRELARGGMGVVFLARDRSLERLVAIKILDPRFVTEWTSRRFIREARILANLSHPNIIPVHRAGEAGGLYFYVMDYVDDETLEQRLRRSPMPRERVLQLGRDLLKALEVVHAAGVVHRDIKPGNIFVLSDRAMLADFGIAKPPAESGETSTAPGTVIGTPRYMPPEAMAGIEATPQTDIHAVGMVLYEALTGRHWLTTGQTDVQVDWSGVPGSLKRILDRALRFDPQDRWPDARTFRREWWKTRTTRYRRSVAIGVPATVVATFALSVLLGDLGHARGIESVPASMIPEGRDARNALARAERLYGMARWDDARRAYETALESAPDCVWCSWMITETSRWSMVPPDAGHIEAIRSHLAEFPEGYRIVALSRALALAPRIDTLRWAANQWTGNRQIGLQLGAELFHRGPLVNRRRSEAVEVLRSVVRSNPSFAPAWEFLAWAETVEGNREGAREALDRLESIDAEGTPDAIAEPLRKLLLIGFTYRFGDGPMLNALLTELVEDEGGQTGMIDGEWAAAGPRLLPAFGSPEGAVNLGGLYASMHAPHLARSGLASQMLGYFAMGMLDSAEARAQTIEATFGAAAGFGLLWNKLIAIIEIVDPEAAEGRDGWRNLRRYATSVEIQGAERRHIDWLLQLGARLGEGGSVPQLAGEAPDSADLLDRLVLASEYATRGDYGAALRLSDTLAFYETATALTSAGEETREHDVFRSVVHLLRSGWYLARAESLPAYQTLRWHENSDQATLPLREPRQQEVDWALGPLAAWKRATIIESMAAGNKEEMCAAYSYVARVWEHGDPVFSGRARRAAASMLEQQCPG